MEPLLSLYEGLIQLLTQQTIKSETVESYIGQLNGVVEAAHVIQTGDASIGFWKNYLWLERIYNAVEVKPIIDLFILAYWIVDLTSYDSVKGIRIVRVDRNNHSRHSQGQQAVWQEEEEESQWILWFSCKWIISLFFCAGFG